MYCGKCGAELRKEAKFCAKCGALVHNSAGISSSKAPSQKVPPHHTHKSNQVHTESALKIWINPLKDKLRHFGASQGKKRLVIAAGVLAIILLVLSLAFCGISSRRGQSISLNKGGASNGIINGFGTVLLLAFFVVALVCAIKESDTTGTYKTFGVYGRLKAWLFTNLLLSGTLYVLAIVTSPFTGLLAGIANAWLYLLIALAASGMSAAIFIHSHAKCPAMLRPRLLQSMLLSGLGVNLKLCVFFHRGSMVTGRSKTNN